jgi:hypothetical protein
MKAGSAIASRVWEMWGKVTQAGKIGENLLARWQAWSARAERVAVLWRQSERARYVTRCLDIVVNGIGESIIGLALLSSLKNIKTLSDFSRISLHLSSIDQMMLWLVYVDSKGNTPKGEWHENS